MKWSNADHIQIQYQQQCLHNPAYLIRCAQNKLNKSRQVKTCTVINTTVQVSDTRDDDSSNAVKYLEIHNHYRSPD